MPHLPPRRRNTTPVPSLPFKASEMPKEAPKANICDLTEDDFPSTLTLVLPVQTQEGVVPVEFVVDAFEMKKACTLTTDEEPLDNLWINVRSYLVNKLSYSQEDANNLGDKHIYKIWSNVTKTCDQAFLFFFPSLGILTEEDT